MDKAQSALTAAIEAVKIYSPFNFYWYGQRSEQLPSRVRKALSPKSARDFLRTTLRARLYRDFYRHGVPMAEGLKESAAPLAMGLTPFIELLAAANAGDGYWSEGWVVRRIEAGKVIISRDSLQVFVDRDSVVGAHSASIDVGEFVRVRMPNQSLGASPGHYIAFGNRALGERSSPGNILRIYWNITTDGGPELVKHLTEKMNEKNLPFHLKVLSDPSLYMRCDAGILYVESEDYGRVSDVLTLVYAMMSSVLKRATPAFTKRLADGLALAEDPGSNQSFGMHRCGLMAEGLIRAHERGQRKPDLVLGVIRECFTEHGLVVDRAFLNPDRRDVYTLPKPLHSRSQGHVVGTAPEHRFLTQSSVIAKRLAAQAIWHGDICNWVGAAPERSVQDLGDRGVVYAALGPELYNGTSGISLFMAEVCARTGDHSARQVALGAARHALSRPIPGLNHGRWGLYTGWPGIALATMRIGALVESDEIITLSHRYINRHMTSQFRGSEIDLLSGLAGGVVGLLVLAESSNRFGLDDLAVALGDEILAAAEQSSAGVSWATIPESSQNLTGMAHGAAGIGYALTHIYARTGHSRFRDGADGAFAYERSWYDADRMNWPDFRLTPGQDARSKAPYKYSTDWCHGAPGIGVSRAAAAQHLHREEYRDETLEAAATTRARIKESIGVGADDFSLCHGIAGRADLLMELMRVTNLREHDLVVEIADLGIQRHGGAMSEWPCGCEGETPGLLLGLAGIGYFYLRVQDMSVPSPLNIDPVSWKLASPRDAAAMNA